MQPLHGREYFNTLSEAQQQTCKSKYAIALSIPHSPSEVSLLFYCLPVDTVQKIYLALVNVFTPDISNEYRVRIIQELNKIPQDQWTDTVNQVQYIMPKGTIGHDVFWAMQILTEINDPSLRLKVARTANRLITPNHITRERGYILTKVAQLGHTEMEALRQADDATEANFVRQCIPDNVTNGKTIVSRHDAITEQTWDPRVELGRRA